MVPAIALTPVGKQSNHVRDPRDGEESCCVCRRPVLIKPKTRWLWVHLGGSHAVTREEGERLNAAGERGADLGLRPIGSDCLRRHPELAPYLQEEGR